MPSVNPVILCLSSACITFAACRSASPRSDAQASGSAREATVRMARSQTLPQMDGKRLEVKLIEVSYGPGGSSRAHSHPCAVFGYVLQGALRSQVQGEAEATYRAGESFYEAPNGVHAVSANASNKDSVRFLATFVCDSSAALSTPVPER